MNMTSLEARAHCIAVVLNTEPESWGKAQADAAASEAKKLLAAKAIDVDTFTEIVPVVSGNHSAMRQKLVSYGLLASKEADSAEKRQILATMEKLSKAADEALAEATK
jgi:hypothetical protein